MSTIEEIAKQIKDNMQQRWSVESSKGSPIPPSGTPSHSLSAKATEKFPVLMNTSIQWEIPIELCPHCMARLKGMPPAYVKGWTNPAKESWMKKKQPGIPKAPEIAEDKGVKKVKEF